MYTFLEYKREEKKKIINITSDIIRKKYKIKFILFIYDLTL